MSRLQVSGQLQSVLTRALERKARGKVRDEVRFPGSGSLAQRIANSFCRICMQRGHWKNECPQRNQQDAGANSSTTAASSIPTSFVIAEEIPEEVAHFAVAEAKDSCGVSECLGVQCHNWGYKGHNGDKVRNQGKSFAIRFANQWRQALRAMKSSDPSVAVHAESTHPELPKSASDSEVSTESCLEANFVSTGTMGIVNLGASQTVIGDKQVPELLQQLPQNVRDRIQRTSCNLTFRFGNQQTLACKHALLLPLGTAQFRLFQAGRHFCCLAHFSRGLGPS